MFDSSFEQNRTDFGCDGGFVLVLDGRRGDADDDLRGLDDRRGLESVLRGLGTSPMLNAALPATSCVQRGSFLKEKALKT